MRLLTDDPPEMAAAASALADRAEVGEVRLRLDPLVVAEVAWVLGSFYDLPRPRIAQELSRLATAEGIEAEDGDLVARALEAMGAANVDFVDAYLAEKARRTGEPVCSFDRDFARLGVEHVVPGDTP